MKLEKFNKNKKRNLIIIGSVMGILLIIGSIALLRTYAFFEEKKEFNVLKGQIPKFSQADIQLAWSVNGEKQNRKFPNRSDGYTGTSVSCEDGVTAEWDNSEWGLTNINSSKDESKKIYCSVDFKEGLVFSNVKVGDYVSYTPEKTSYDIPNMLTGMNNYSGVDETSNSIKNTGYQTINPSELKLWRVIRKNEDGSIDLVSEYTSSKEVYFKGKEGYKNYIGTLNAIAKSYETPGITSGSRYMGYDGQTEFIADETALNSTTAPWTGTTTDSNSPKGSEREKLGGGGYLFTTDEALVKAACGNTLKTNKLNTSTASSYWLAGRLFGFSSSSDWVFDAHVVNASGNLDHFGLYNYYGAFYESVSFTFIRPIVTLKSGIQSINGNGSQGSPWKTN